MEPNQNVQPTNQQQTQGNAPVSDGLTPVDNRAAVDRILAEAPIIDLYGNRQPVNQSAVANNADQDDYIVRPPQVDSQSQQQPDNQQDQSNNQQQAAQPKKVKIGSLEMTEQEWGEAAKDRKDRSQWVKNLTQLSQIAKSVLPNLDEEDVKVLLPFALATKKLPANLKSEVLKMSELPETITVTDNDGLETEISTKSLPAELIEKIAASALIKAWPELSKLREDHKSLLEEHNTIKSTMQSQNDRMAEMMVLDLMKQHPDMAISVRKGESVKENIETIITAGPSHPEFINAQKFVTLSQFAGRHGMTFEQAYTAFFGTVQAQAAARQQILENQQTDLTRERGNGQILDPLGEYIRRANEGSTASQLRRMGI